MAYSRFWTYFLWLAGGWFGLHHLYLRRYRHAFITLWTMGGGLGVGWFLDLFYINDYVELANYIHRHSDLGPDEARFNNDSVMQRADDTNIPSGLRRRGVNGASSVGEAGDSNTNVRTDANSRTSSDTSRTTGGGFLSTIRHRIFGGGENMTSQDSSSSNREAANGMHSGRVEDVGTTGIRLGITEAELVVYGSSSWHLGKIAGELIFSLMLGMLVAGCVPNDYTLNYPQLTLSLSILAVAIGVHVVANIGTDSVSFRSCLLGMALPLGFQILSRGLELKVQDVLMSLCVSSMISANRSRGPKHVRRKRNQQRRCERCSEILLYTFACSAMLGIITVGLYYNATVTNRDGETIMFRDALNNILESPAWLELKAALNVLWYQFKREGFSGFYKQFIISLDAEGEEAAYRILNLTSEATEKDIQSVYKRLALRHHPDKVKVSTEEERREAEEYWVKVTQAYDRLSRIKKRRNQRNSAEL